MEVTTLSAIITLQSRGVRKRVGNLNAVERYFAKDYGKTRLTEGRNVDNNCMKRIQKCFPGFIRDEYMSKKC
jgi:hypothetical protein